MSLLTLKDIGKIYVSESNVAVGIRGVNLSFDKCEFVAITGKSGSGKSTLLNVISGMDTYEEGELYIEGEPTSHFLQPEWEEYRQKYISFIFQDYNIIESYTVLENVELALMHITDKKERRRRAIELLDRVGMHAHLHHKGSKLSGGQKQRTVIARALAKDSPIILADEPTGNLDHQTSLEIIELLREVSKDKLLIIVTHNFDQVENVATRHIRVFDGQIESDQVLIPTAPPVTDTSLSEDVRKKPNKHVSDMRNGFTLGNAIFKSTPKLSIFLCILMLIGTFGIFLVTAFCGDAAALFDPYYMFNNIEGRVVLVKRSGEVITDEELEKIKTDYGAKSYLHYDLLLDENETYVYIDEVDDYCEFRFSYGENITPDIGRSPEKPGEVLVSVPYSFQDAFGKDSIKLSRIDIGYTTLTVVGVHYYKDNNITPTFIFNEDGFRCMTAIYKMNNNGYMNISVDLYTLDGENKNIQNQRTFSSSVCSFDIEGKKLYFSNNFYNDFIDDLMKKDPSAEPKADISINVRFDKWMNGWYSEEIFEKKLTESVITTEFNDQNKTNPYRYYDMVFSASLITEIYEDYLKESYTQASVFFNSGKEAKAAAEILNKEGYIAVPADTTYEADTLTVITNSLAVLGSAFLWLLAVIFLAFFINLCSIRTLGAFKGDMAIMRSMGISVKVIKIGMYVRMLISLIPAYVLVILTAVFGYRIPKINGILTYLYFWQYAVIFIGMLILTARVTRKQVKKLFNESVKKSLKGGNAE